MTEFSSLAGRLLVAMPGIGDPRFEHAVIIVCAHGPDHAMGLRIDRPAPGVDLKSVLQKLDSPGAASAAGRPVLVGGPVERERGFVLHTDDWMADDSSVGFGEGLAITGTREALAAMTRPVMGPRRSVLALGYAGWGDGQLEDELADNVWLVAEPDLELLFDTDFDTKWARALASLGVDAAMLSVQTGRA
ncbi:MAG: YqgE/AlgH family protein [Brevundimonas sp.]|jgi:putative transcriptional regulator|nr:YqgE/AlgH family protein [Brevundimonas sp.]MCA3718985.1 YqgE/AlgH family protein [Brevundimonas sp.]